MLNFLWLRQDEEIELWPKTIFYSNFNCALKIKCYIIVGLNAFSGQLVYNGLFYKNIFFQNCQLLHTKQRKTLSAEHFTIESFLESEKHGSISCRVRDKVQKAALED